MLPPPSWVAVNRHNGHAHMVYGLSAPVLLTDGSQYARHGPVRKLEAVERAISEKLEADTGYAGLITKNPAHPLWRVLRGPRLGYGLNELEEWLPDIERYVHKRGRAAVGKGIRVGIGRNVELFDRLRHWAYRHIRHYKGEGNFVIWQSALYDKALERNADFAVPLDPREAWHVSKSVAKWVWNRFDVAKSDREFSGLQAHRRLNKKHEEILRWALECQQKGR